MGILTYFLGFILVTNIILGISIVFLERKSATSTWAWLMVLLFIPILGFFLYLIFGRPIYKRKIFTWDTKSRQEVKTTVNKQILQIEEKKFQFRQKELHAFDDLVYLHLKNDEAIFTQDNKVDIFIDGKEKFKALIEDMEQARDHIHLQYYIYKHDELGQRIARTLIRKAKEGVEVRVLYDDLGSRTLSRKYVRRLKEAGVKIVPFSPAKTSAIKVNLEINYRNHRKLGIIDGKIGYIGGFNVGDEYLGKYKRFGYWRDTHLRIQGHAVQSMQTRFILDWNHASTDQLQYERRLFDVHSAGETGIQIVSSGPDSEWEQIKNGYIKMILSAKEYIYIQTPYFIPDESLLDALRIAALSGTKIKLMIPNKPDHPFVYWATLSYCGDLLRAGAEVYIYQNGFLHAKTIVVDGKISSVGTANIDVRSFRLNFEVNAFIYDERIAQKLTNSFNDDIRLSKELTRKEYNQRPLKIRMKESISRLLSPLL